MKVVTAKRAYIISHLALYTLSGVRACPVENEDTLSSAISIVFPFSRFTGLQQKNPLVALQCFTPSTCSIYLKGLSVNSPAVMWRNWMLWAALSTWTPSTRLSSICVFPPSTSFSMVFRGGTCRAPTGGWRGEKWLLTWLLSSGCQTTKMKACFREVDVSYEYIIITITIMHHPHHLHHQHHHPHQDHDNPPVQPCIQSS